MEGSSFIKVTSIINRSYSSMLIDELFKNGIQSVFIEAGRTNILEERKQMLALGNNKKLINDPGDILYFLIEKKYEPNIMDFMDQVLDLSNPGKATVFSTDINLIDSNNEIFHNKSANFNQNTPFEAYNDLCGISCIVQRSQGDNLARLILDSGISVPVTTYGTGTGVRDKLGLLRITIPAEKEIITLITSKADADAVMELMIAEGNLSQPGKGFIYTFPVLSGYVNTKISRGETGQVASFEQVIAAIDSLKGNIEWRSSQIAHKKSQKLVFLSDLTELNLICNEGYASDLMKIAMENGAPGATVSTLKFKTSLETTKYLPSREICKMIVGTNNVQQIADALKNADAFSDESQALLYSQSVGRAFTYLGKS